MSKRTPKGEINAVQGNNELSPRWRETIDELGKLRDVLKASEPIENHFRVDVVTPDPS